MPKCEICGKGLMEGLTLHRQNPKGETGIWRCEGCNRLPVDPELAEITALIQNAGKPPLQ